MASGSQYACNLYQAFFKQFFGTSTHIFGSSTDYSKTECPHLFIAVLFLQPCFWLPNFLITTIFLRAFISLSLCSNWPKSWMYCTAIEWCIFGANGGLFARLTKDPSFLKMTDEAKCHASVVVADMSGNTVNLIFT